jgi:glyceraldehyde 3-phosphate dehydrogenase/glyceraldehyde-3-phosphate dehydrogenase (NAD(P))
MKKIAINGLGRIGRMVLRNYLLNPPANVEIVAANDLTPIDELVYLIQYDSVHGRAVFPVKAGSDYIQIGPHKLAILTEKNPEKLPWNVHGVDVVLECTGLFRRREDAAKHLKAGASKVIISAPSESADLTIVLGVNEKLYDTQMHHIISNASCTTNSLAPAVKVLHDTFGVEYLMVTTIHAYTASQALIDKATRKRRRGRAAAVSLIPTSTGAAKATALVIPELKGRMDAIAVRAPIPDGAITDIVAYLKKDVTIETVNTAFKKASEGVLQGILDYSEDEIVSADIIGDTHSGIVDASSTRVIMNRVVKVLVWYDNEYGYSRRLLELSDYISR